MVEKIKATLLEVQEKNATKIGFIESELPALKEKEVLIKVKYVPLIHYDTMKMSGVTGATFPFTPCVELSGVIEDAFNKALIGKKVSFLSLKFGTLRNYAIATEDEILVLKDDADLIKASQMSCNPFTASGIVDTAVELKANAFALTAGNSHVGKIIYRIAQDKGIKCIPIVRSAGRKKEMESEGFENVVDSSDEKFIQNLNKIMQDLNSQLIFDTLAGPIVGQLMKALPKNGILVNFGTQTHEPYSGIDATDMRWGNKQMRCFLVGPWIDQKIKEGTFETHKKYVSDNPSIFDCVIGDKFSWKDFDKAVKFANENPNAPKVIISIDEN